MLESSPPAGCPEATRAKHGSGPGYEWGVGRTGRVQHRAAQPSGRGRSKQPGHVRGRTHHRGGPGRRKLDRFSRPACGGRGARRRKTIVWPPRRSSRGGTSGRGAAGRAGSSRVCAGSPARASPPSPVPRAIQEAAAVPVQGRRDMVRSSPPRLPGVLRPRLPPVLEERRARSDWSKRGGFPATIPERSSSVLGCEGESFDAAARPGRWPGSCPRGQSKRKHHGSIHTASVHRLFSDPGPGCQETLRPDGEWGLPTQPEGLSREGSMLETDDRSGPVTAATGHREQDSPLRSTAQTRTGRGTGDRSITNRGCRRPPSTRASERLLRSVIAQLDPRDFSLAPARPRRWGHRQSSPIRSGSKAGLRKAHDGDTLEPPSSPCSRGTLG